jgi:hypothetical protein
VPSLAWPSASESLKILSHQVIEDRFLRFCWHGFDCGDYCFVLRVSRRFFFIRSVPLVLVVLGFLFRGFFGFGDPGFALVLALSIVLLFVRAIATNMSLFSASKAAAFFEVLAPFFVAEALSSDLSVLAASTSIASGSFLGAS